MGIVRSCSGVSHPRQYGPLTQTHSSTHARKVYITRQSDVQSHHWSIHYFRFSLCQQVVHFPLLYGDSHCGWINKNMHQWVFFSFYKILFNLTRARNIHCCLINKISFFSFCKIQFPPARWTQWFKAAGDLLRNTGVQIKTGKTWSVELIHTPSRRPHQWLYEDRL